jgi:hypothetical protein
MLDRVSNLAQKLRLAATLSLALLFGLFSPASAAAQATLSANSINFGTVLLYTTSAVETLNVSNHTGAALQNLSYSLPTLTLYAIVPASTTCVKGAALANGANCNIGLTFDPKSGSIAPTSTLTITTTGNAAQKVALSGTEESQVTLSTTTENFGNAAINETSPIQTVTLTNNQGVVLNITSLTVTAGTEYALDPSTTCPSSGTVGLGGSCTIGLTFTPTGLGPQPGATLKISTNASVPVPSVALYGTGVVQVALAPTPLSFSAQFIGATSANQYVTVTNQQNVALTISGASITGANASDFGIGGNCPTAPATLPAGGTCQLWVNFKPTAAGTRTATVNLADNAPSTPQTFGLTGISNAPVTVLPGSITNFTAPVGTTSPYQNITITNAQPSTALHINSLQFSGDFIQSATSCPLAPAALAGGASCTVSVQFDPSIGGVRTGQLQVYDDVATSPQVVNFSGTGTSPLTISPTSLSFSAQTVGTSSAAKTITLTNNETQVETFSLTASGDYSATTNCTSGVIAAKTSCLIYVTFTPSSVTPSTTRTGTLTIANSAANGTYAAGTSPVTAPLTGSATATPPAAAVSVVSPGAGAAGTNVNVVITGNGWTHFSASSVISFVQTDSPSTPCGLSVSSQTLVNANQIDATLTLNGGAGVVYGACNISVASPLSGGGTETASLLSAFIIADPNDAHSITSVAPAFGIQGQTLNVSLTAVGTHFVQGVTFANFGDGITVNSLTITDATDAQANITISNTTYVGYRTITMQTGGEFAVSVLSPQSNPIFQIGPNNAALVSLTPTSSGQNNSLPVSIVATGTHFLQNATVMSMTGGIIVGDVIVTSPTTATAQIIVPANATVGVQNATVSTGGEIETLANCFTVISTTPYLSSVSPSSGVQGQTLNVNITGVNTAFSQNAIQAEFDGNITVNSITVNSPTSVTVNISISSDANVGTITANLLSGPSGNVTPFPFAFTVNASSAAIISVTPSSVPQGAQVTLAVVGSNTIWNQADTTAGFYPVPVPAPSFNEITINSMTSANLAVTVPTNTPPGNYEFWMTTGGQTVNATLNVYANTPTLTMSPANGLLPSGTVPNSFTVNFTGQFTHWNQASTLPVVAGEGVTLSNFTVLSPVNASATITIIGGTNGTPTATGPRLVTITTGGEIVTTYFNVTSTPVGIISISPSHLAQNATADVSIVGLNTHFAPGLPSAGGTQVLFGPQITVNSVTVIDSTHLTANVTTGYVLSGNPATTPPGFQQVYVNTGIEQVTTEEQVLGGFGVDPPLSPSILSVFPNSAAQGSTVDVVITGSLTNWVQGTTEAILGAGVSVSNLTITSPTTATATIAVFPTAPVGGNSVIMITGAQYLSGTGFSVTPSAALIQSVGPDVTCNANYIAAIPGCGGSSTTPWVVAQLQTTTLSVVGVGTHWLQGESVFDFGAGVVTDTLTVNSPTTAIVQITVLSSAPVGYHALTTTTGGEVVTLQQAIDVEEGVPALLAISPTAAEQGATFNLQLLGRFTHWQQGVTSAAFNLDFPADIVVNSINVIDSETMTANVTVSPWSYVDYSYPCGHTITVTTGGEQVAGLPGNFCVAAGGEEITNVFPLQGLQGSTLPITITGSDTNFIQGVTHVSFGDSNFQVGQITVTSPTTLTASVAITTQAQNGFKNVTVSTFGQVASQLYSFSVTPGLPTLTEAIPDQAEQGVQNLNVHLVGQYSHFSALSTATFGSGITVNSVTYTDATDLVANISIDPVSFVGGRTVTVTTSGVPCSELVGTTYACPGGATTGTGSEIVSDNAFTIIAGPAIITGISPAAGNEGQEVVFNITGANTHWQQNFTQFYIAGAGYDLTIHSVVINSSTSATVDMSISQTANAGVRSIYMVTAGESLTDSGAFVVTGGIPAVSYISPNSGAQGASGLEVTVVGNAYTQWNQSTTVNFGPGITVSSYQVDDEWHIEAVLIVDPAAQLGYRTVIVQTGSQQLAGNFQVVLPPGSPLLPKPQPYIWYESPSSGIPGQTLTIYFDGVNTEWNPGLGEACSQSGTTITGFNSSVTVDCFQVTGATSAYATVTISPTATDSQSTLTLTTTGTASYGTEVDFGSFNVIVAQPVLSIVDPGTGMQGAQNITVNILGQFTAFDSTTTFNFGPYITVNGPPTILGPGIATQSISIGQLTPTGGYAVTAYTPDATGSQVTVGGAGFSVTPSLALISAITPNAAQQGATVQVEVAGQNTHWDGATTFQFGAGITVSSTQVNSNTDATLTLVIPALAPEGPTSASATTGGEVAHITNGFVVLPGTPLLLSSGPSSLPQQSSAVFTILSQQTQWSNANPPTVSIGAGVILTNVNVTTPTSLTVDGYVTPTTSVGYRNLTVTSGTQVLGINNAFYVTPGPAAINSVTPNTGGQGVNLPAVQINGTNTNWQQGVTQLSFPGVLINSFTVNSPTSITANITVSVYAAAGQVTVTATTLGEVATGVNVFTITQTQAELLAVVPSSQVQGWTGNVTLTGQYTQFATAAGCAPNCSTANFGAGVTVNSVTALSGTSLQANITVSPTAALEYNNVSVTTGSQVVSLNNAFQITVGPAAIQSLTPNSGAQGATLNVAVVGSQSHFAQGVTTASFGGGITVNTVTVTDALHATVNITIPNNTTLSSYNVSLTTGGEVATILGGFTVTTGSPAISNVNPPTGTQGTTINVTLTGLFTHFLQGTSVASFGSGITVNTLTVNSATSAVANITISQTASISSRNVTVTTNSEVATITGGFSVLAGLPALISDLPTFAQAGTTANIVINSEFTTFQQGFTTVSFGSGVTVNFVTVNSITQVTANITVASNAPVGSQTITVSTNGQVLTLPNGFSVTAGTPVITQINPNFGNPAQTNLTVTITGQYTSWTSASTVTIGTAADGISVGGAPAGTPGPVVSATATSVTVSVSIASGAPLGPAGVSVTTGVQTQSVAGGFTVQAAVIPAPSVISLSPGNSAGGMPINSSIIAVFSQPMNRTTINTSSVEVWLVSNPSGWVTVPGTVNVDATGRVMTFTPIGLLAVNAEYYLLMTNAIKDATGNTFPQYGYVALYTQYTANSAPATVVAANPPANATNVGTNVTVQLEFSADMNQSTQSGLTVSTGGNPISGTYSWNASPTCNCGPGTILTFTPTTALAANTTYTVTYNSTLADTAGNPLTPGSFSFTTGSAADTAYNYSGSDFTSGLTNAGTNFVPKMNFSKPINPIDINTGTLLLYNADSGKYIAGTVNVAANGLSATFTPTYPLLPDTYYRFYQAGGDYDMDGNYLYGVNDYFTTGAGADLTPPTVASISPVNNATAVPLNAQVTVHFSAPVDPDTISNSVAVTPSGGSAIPGTTSLSSDMVTLTFVPSGGLLPGTVYAVQVSGYSDPAGNAGVAFSSSFTTTASIAPIVLTTGLNAAGNLITVNNTPDGHWTYVATTSLPGSGGVPYYLFSEAGTSQPLEVVGSGDAGFYSGWPVNGPGSDWININPNSTTGNTLGVYSTTFNIPGPSVPSNLCLVGFMGVDDYGELGINGTAITGNISAIGSLASLNIPVSSYLVVGSNTLALGWGSTDNSYEAFRLQAVIETCGASYTGGLTLTTAVPANNATNVATNTNITLTFNHALDPATVNSTTLPVMIGWNSNAEIAGSYQVNGNQVIFTPDSPFPASTNIWVGACGGPYDTAGDSAGGCYTQLTNFTTGSTATAAPNPFQVIAFAPAASATNVGLRAPVTATFNRSVNLNSVNSSDFALFAGDGQSPWCTSESHSQDGSTLQFNCGVLPASTPMTEMLGSGLSDWQGNALVPFTNQFTTTYYDSNTNGTVISTRPGNGATGVNGNLPIVLYTNLPINPATAPGGIEVAENNAAVPGTVQVLDNGYTLEFMPSSAFTAGALIQWWTTGSLYESTYNTPVNGASGYFYVAASTGALVPAVQTASPTYGETSAVNSIVDLQFNTPLNPSTVNSTNIYLYDGTTGLHVGGTYTMPQPNEVRIVPSANFGANRYIYVYLTTGLQSATSVPFGSTTWVTYFYTGNPVDTTLPLVVSAVPYNGAGNVGVNVDPGVVFNKAIDPVSLNSSTFQVLNGGTPLAGSYWFSSSDTRIEFVPNAPLPANTSLTMSLNGVLDQVGNPVTYSSTFQTGAGPDLTSPTVVWTSIPTNGSIPTNSMITIQFSESMDVTTFSTGPSGDIYIYDTLLGTRVPATLSWNATQSVAYLLPGGPLSAGREYYFYASSGTDLAGNVLSGIEITFYAELTSAGAAPTVINFNPLNGATGLGTNAVIEAQFSAPIDPNTIGGVTLSTGGSTVTTTPSMGAGNTILQLVPATPLRPNTTYTMTIAGVKDPAGNLVATVTNTFTTGATYDDTAAAVVSVDPPNNSTVGTNVVAKMLFNKPLNPTTVNNSSIVMYLNDTGQWIPLTVTLSANGLEVSLQPQIALLANTEYRFYAGYNSYVQDQDGNNLYAGWYYFYTGGGAVTTGPTVTVSPANGATGIPLNAKVQVSVSSIMDPTSWTQSSIQVLNGATPVAGTVSESTNQMLLFTPTSALSSGTLYTVNVSGFTDANGNAVVPSSTTFTTGGTAATPGLSIISSNIPNGSSNVSATSPITLTFSQILDAATVTATTLPIFDGWNSARPIAGTYTVNGAQVTFTPTNPYPAGAQIWVGGCYGPTDILGDVLTTGCWAQELYFNVISGAAGPTSLHVLSVSPANGATNVGRDQPVSVTFNNSINNNSTGGYNVQLYAGQDLQTNGSVTNSADGRTLTFNIGALTNGATYTVVIPAGGLSDNWGNTLSSPFTSTFTVTVDPATGNGSVQSEAPGNGATGVPTDTLLTLYMNRQVNASTLPGQLTVTVNGAVYGGTVQAVASGYEIQFMPATPFPNGATVQWFLSGSVLDVNGDAFNGNSGYFYTVAAANPAAAPANLNNSPGYGVSNVPTNADIYLQYSLPLNNATLTSSNVYLYDGSNGTYPAITITQPEPGVVELAPNAQLTAGSLYYACANGNVQGTNGIGISSGCWETYFYAGSTPDTTPGSIIIGPPNGSVNVGTNAYIRLQFSKPINRALFSNANIQITTGGNPIPGTWSFNYNSGTNDAIGANFSPVNPLPPSSPISVSVSGVLDYAGNTFASASSNFTTAALPDYSTPTATLDFAYGTAGIGTNASFTCLYSEPMDPSSVNSGNTYIYSYVTSGHIPVTYAWASDLMAVTMTPATPLFANTEYYYYCGGAIDLTGNGMSATDAIFYTGNGAVTTGPSLVAINPPNGMTNVPVNTNNGPWYGSSLGMLFNEPVAADSLGSITLTPAGGSPIPIAVYPEDGNFMAWVQLPYSLLPNTTYTYNVTGVMDLNGNAMTPATSTFTTGSSFNFTNPTATAATPANGATGVAVNAPITLTFSTAMNPVLIGSSQIYLRTHNTQTTVPTTLSISSSATATTPTTVTLTPVTPLAESTIYDLVYWPNNWYLYDIAGNYESQYGVETTFTTGTTSAVNGACGSANGGSFSSAPTANLCSAGTASALTNPGSWTWSCNGEYGGTNASCSATVTGTPACSTQLSSLQGLWPGTDNTNDYSPNSYNGTAENGVTYALGEVGDAFSLNGNNQYVLIGEPVPANLQIQSAITLSAWIYPTALPTNNGSGALGLIAGSQIDGVYGGATIFFDGRVNPDGGQNDVPAGHIQFNLGDGSNWHPQDTETQVPLNQWTLITATATSGAAGKVYYNGVLQPSNSGSYPATWNGTVSYPSNDWFAIGQEVNENRPFTGLINDVQVYNAALTPAQIQAIYNAGSGGVCQ